MGKKKSVILRAPTLTQSGYGVHARQVARWLFALADANPGKIEVVTEPLPWGRTPWILNPEEQDGLIGRILQSARQLPHYDVSIQLQLPNEWNPLLADYNVGMTAGVEADRCNPAWVEAINKMDLVIVPSEFVKQAFLNSGEITTEIKIIPESFIDACVDDSVQPLEGFEPKTDFNFLVFSQFTANSPDADRKNIPYTIRWMNEVFADRPDVGLVLKTNMGRQTTVDRINVLNYVTQLVRETKRGPGPQIYILHGDMTDKEIVGLYRHPKIKALVSLTHGEGFGLPLLEAAVCGLPVLATGWSAHNEFLSKGKYMKVDYALGEVHASRHDGQIYLPGFKWANPAESDVKRKLTRFCEDPSVPQKWAKDLATTLRASHSFGSISEQYSEAFDSLLLKDE
jgi:glycosyltransferase involved in cell wall biosynthesis